MKNTCLYQLFCLTSHTETETIDIIDGKNR
jgi:hypothetical protein